MSGRRRVPLRRNPPLVVFSNPRSMALRGASPEVRAKGRYVGKISEDLHDVRYTHFENGLDFKHDFGPGVEMWAIEEDGQRRILLTHKDGKPLWGDYDDSLS